MLTRLRHRAHGQEGFTLIELLVVILIIGILAAVAIPAFLNQKGKANDANTKSDVNTAQTAEETYFTDGQAYTANTSDLTNIDEPTLTQSLPVNAPGTPEGGHHRHRLVWGHCCRTRDAAVNFVHVRHVAVRREATP